MGGDGDAVAVGFEVHEEAWVVGGGICPFDALGPFY